jgi:hypothetical protein
VINTRLRCAETGSEFPGKHTQWEGKMCRSNECLIPQSEFAVLVEKADQEASSAEDAHMKVWYAIANRINAHWDGICASFYDSLTPGQFALVCTARLHRYVKHGDLLGFVTCETAIAIRTFRALQILGADDYLGLLRQAEEVFPNKQFPECAEDVMRAIRKVPPTIFDEIGSKLLTGEGMKRTLHDHVASYVAAHPEDFCTA